MVYYLKKKHLVYILQSVFGDFDNFLTNKEKNQFLKENTSIKLFGDLEKKIDSIFDTEYWITKMIEFMERNKIGYYEEEVSE